MPQRNKTRPTGRGRRLHAPESRTGKLLGPARINCLYCVPRFVWNGGRENPMGGETARVETDGIHCQRSQRNAQIILP